MGRLWKPIANSSLEGPQLLRQQDKVKLYGLNVQINGECDQGRVCCWKKSPVRGAAKLLQAQPLHSTGCFFTASRLTAI